MRNMDSEYQKEQELRSRIFRKRLRVAGIWFLAAIIAIFLTGYLPAIAEYFGLPESVVHLLSAVLKLTYAVGAIVSVCKFAGTMHNPLTPKEAEELKRRETLEKTGETERKQEII